MTVAFVALALERALGYPSPLRRFIGHPANGLYLLNGVFAALVPDAGAAATRRVIMGAAFCLLSVSVTLALAIVATVTLRTFPYAWFWEGLLAVPFLAQYALRVRARAVADALDTDLGAAQGALTHLVNHDLSQLDKSETARGCLEALAQNTATAVVTPAIWLALFGLPGIIAVSALSAVHRRLGGDHKARTFARLLDTAANYLPARLTGLLFAGAASMTSPSAGARALEIIWQDAGKADNLISGWPECSVAGALDIRLGGPRLYGDSWVERNRFGDGVEHVTTQDLRAGLKLLAQTLTLFTLLVGIAAAFA
ncbi:MAG: CobD/CbiB family cobalamin biosynthesis protein [Pseudomonadota bacterium]